MKKVLIPIVIVISVFMFFIFFETKIEYSILEIDNRGHTKKFYVIRNKKLFSEVVETDKYNSLKEVKIIRNFINDTICLSKSYFNLQKGWIDNFQFCCPSIIIDSLTYTDFGFKSRLHLKDKNSSVTIGELYYEITEVVFGDRDLKTFYEEKLKVLLTDKFGEYKILEENISSNYISTTVLYGNDTLKRVSKNKIIKDGDLVYNVEFSFPYLLYVTYSDFVSLMFIQTGLKDQINLTTPPQ